MSSSPLWRGGGRIFPNSPDENFTHKVNKKMYRAGICSILSQLAREERLVVVETCRSKRRRPSCCRKSCRHGPGIGPGDHRHHRRKPAAGIAQPAERAGCRATHADPMSLVFYKKVLVTKAALAKIEEMYA
jgi:large subunit ribosomal protein L4